MTDILHVDDFCEAILKICKSKTKNGIFNVGSGRPIKLRTIVETIHKFRNKEFRFAYKKTKQNKINNYCYSDNSLIQKTFNWKPKISLEGFKDVMINELVKIEKKYFKYFYKSGYDFRELFVAKILNDYFKNKNLKKKLKIT